MFYLPEGNTWNYESLPSSKLSTNPVDQMDLSMCQSSMGSQPVDPSALTE